MTPKKSTPGQLIRQYRICICSFLLPFLSMMLIFISNEIFPFGDQSFMHSDMYHQYVPFLQEFTRKVREGESLAYSWNIGLGSNYLALFIYYCASPFNWLALLLPPAYLIEFMSYMVVFKIGLAGFTFSFYLKKHFRTDSWAVVFFSLFYAMSGFVAAYNWNVMWIDCLFLAPLVILGLESLVKEGKCRLYCISLALCILSNYYLSIMLCIFLCLYFLVLLAQTSFGTDLVSGFKQILKTAGRFALYSVLAGGISCILLLPELAALSASEYTQFNFPDTVKFYFSLFDMLARHATGVQAEAGLDHWPNIFCSSAVFFLIPLYVLNQKIPVRQKVSQLLLCIFILFGFSTNLLNYIWHGFNYPNSLPARQSFLYIFLVLTMCFEAVHKLEGFTVKQLMQSFGFGLGFLFLADKLVTDDAFTRTVFVVSMVLAGLYLLFLYLYKTHSDTLIRQFIVLALLVITTFEATYHMSSTSVSTTSRSKYLDPLAAYESLADQIRIQDPGFYRFEKTSRTTKNDGALADYPTASCFSSTANARAGNWYDRMGLADSKVFYCSDGLTPFSAALLNVKYMFSKSADEDTALYTLIAEENGIYLYRCRYTLPAGFVLPAGCDMASENFTKTTADPLELQNQMGLSVYDSAVMYEPVSVTNEGTKATLTADTAGHYYAYSQNSKVDTVKMESESGNKTYKKVKYDYILDLGYQEAGNTVTLTNSGDGALKLVAYRLNTDALSIVLQTLSETPFTITDYDATSLTGQVTLSESGTLVLPVAYESGWTLYADGKETEPASFDELFISTQLSAGTHEIELVFFPKGLRLGIAVSLLCLTLFVLIQFVCVPGKMRSRKTSVMHSAKMH